MNHIGQVTMMRDHQSERRRLEDALDFLETLPAMIELAGGTVHYLVEPEDVVRIHKDCHLTGAALLVQLVFARSDYQSEVVLDVPGQEEILLYVNGEEQS